MRPPSWVEKKRHNEEHSPPAGMLGEEHNEEQTPPAGMLRGEASRGAETSPFHHGERPHRLLTLVTVLPAQHGLPGSKSLIFLTFTECCNPHPEHQKVKNVRNVQNCWIRACGTWVTHVHDFFNSGLRMVEDSSEHQQE